MTRPRILRLGASVLLTLAACGERPSPSTAAGAASSDAAAPATTASGSVVEVRMVSDERGNRFEPAAVTAHPGDILRLTLVTGAHNLHFLPDSNVGRTALPPASDVLQLPGQTVDIPLTLTMGKYFFQCDPHAVLGMTGRLEIAP